MKKLLLLMLLALPAYGQDNDPWGSTIYKQFYRFLNQDSTWSPTGTRLSSWSPSKQMNISYLDSVDEATTGTLYLEYMHLNIGSINDNGEQGISFEQPDGKLYLYASPNMDATVVQTFPFDSGRVDVHNVLSLGQDSFDGVTTEDTVTVSGALSTDIYFITPTGLAPSEIFSVEALTDKFVVHRVGSHPLTDLVEGQTYNWRRFRQ